VAYGERELMRGITAYEIWSEKRAYGERGLI
jgi:hypothetical protein